MQRKSKGSLAFCSLPGYERLASLADFLFRPTPLPRLFAGYITYTENEIKGFYDQLLILKIKTKTLTTSDRGKTAVSRKVVGKARLIDTSTPHGIVVPSLFQYFKDSLENGVCKNLCQSVKKNKLGSKATVSKTYLILKLLLM